MDKRSDYVGFLQDILDNKKSFGDVKSLIPIDNRAFFNMLFMSLFRNLTFIKQEVLPQFIKRKIPNKQKTLKYVLYLGITELLFMDKPNYAVVNSYTEITKKSMGRFGANFVNAVLRQVAKQKDDLLKDRKTKYFSIDFLNILKQDYTSDEISAMEDMVCVEPPLDLTLKENAKITIDGAVPLPWGNIRLPANTKIDTLPFFDNGVYWAQDTASSLAVRCLGNIAQRNVLDLCAAPGGKTAQLLDAGAIVTAVDISDKRLERLTENMNRLHFFENLKIICSDALCFESEGKFDIVLLDAPCSATGTFRRHPEIMNIKTADDVKRSALLQQKILERVPHLLKKDGLLVYATCSLAKEEGEKQINRFIKAHPEYTILPIKIPHTENMLTKEGFLRILPQHLKNFGGIDGFFVAVLQRKI